jgi:ATP-dependent DNA ligase
MRAIINAATCDPVDFATTRTPEHLGDDYWYEQKMDGDRVLVQVEDGLISVFNRNAEPRSRFIPVRVDAPGTWIIDGEWMDDGTYWAFDLPVMNGQIVKHTLRDRRFILEDFLHRVEHSPNMRILPKWEGEKKKLQLVQEVHSLSLEGVVIKHVAGTYGTRWLKAKNYHTADVVVTSLRDDGKENVTFAVISGTGEWKEVGRCALLGTEIAVGDVVEVRYLYMSKKGRLIQPTLQRRRDDKTARECDMRQFSTINKLVLGVP